MGIYIYKVTPETKLFDGILVNVMKYAYKQYSGFGGGYKENAQMRFGSQCWRADRLVQSDEFTGRVVMEGNGPLSKVWVDFPKHLIEEGDGTLDDYEIERLVQAKRSKKYVQTEVQIYRQDLSNLDNQRRLLSESRNFIDLQQTHVANIIVEHSEDDLLSEVLELAWKSTENENYDHLNYGWVMGDHVTWTTSLIGQRSNTPGDHFFIKGTLFRVAPTGFEQLCVDGMRMSWHEPDYCKLSELK